jgi:RLL motif-containing protein 1
MVIFYVTLIYFIILINNNSKDKALNEAAKILRLLHIKELRDLQTKINEAIVTIQKITANPKTDSSLGRVGI